MSKFEKVEDLKIANGFIQFPENEQLEYKKFFRREAIPIYIKTLVAMANTEGGCFVFGAFAYKQKAIMIHLDKSQITLIQRFEQSINSFLEEEYIGVIDTSFSIFCDGKRTIAMIFVKKSSTKIIRINDEKILVRDGDRTVSQKTILNESQIKEIDIRKHIKFVNINKYSDYSTLKNYMVLENQAKWQYLYKYMTLEAFIQCIENENIMFQEPIGWEDQYEVRFYKADYSILKAQVEDTPKMFATCATREEENEAAWKVYARGNAGLEARCVQIKIDLGELRKWLDYSATNGFNSNSVKFVVYEGKVSYVLNEQDILSLNKKDSPLFNHFFVPFNIEHFIGLHLYKRPAYSYEDEVRFFLIPKIPERRNVLAKKAGKVFITLPWQKIIKEVRIDKRCSTSEKLALRAICEDKGIILSAKDFSVRKTKKTITSIPARPFDIDKMPGKKKITIGF